MDFSIEIARQALLIQEKKGFKKNFACSPLSINVFLNMIASGSSKDSILEKLLIDLGFTNVDDLNIKSSQLLALANKNDDDVLKKKDEGPLVCFANGVWVHQSFNLKSSYQQILKSIYKVDPKSRDFYNKRDEVIEEVNLWVKNATKGLIDNIIEPTKFKPYRKIILVNALYFKGVWKKPFDKSMTKHRNFHLLNGETVKVPFMHKKCMKYAYGSFVDEGFRLLKLRYRKSKGDQRLFSMSLFLPNKRDGLPDLIQHFSSNPGFINQDFKLEYTTIDNLMIPKFKFTIKLNVSKSMPSILNIGELLERVDSPNEKLRRCTLIYQKCHVEIDEEGTKAAAVTYDDDLGCSLDWEPPPPLDFIVNHPFMFMIKEETSKVPFFIGAVFNPRLGK